MSGIRKKFFFQILYAFSQLAFPLITYPYITRKLGAAGLGAIGYVEYLSGFVITLASFGIPFYGVRQAARLQNNPLQRAALLRQIFSFHLLVSLLGCGLFVALLKVNYQQVIPSSLVVLGCVNIILPAFIAEWYMQGTEAFVFTTIRGLFLRLLGLTALFIFVNSQADYIIYYLIIILVQMAVAITNMYKSGPHNFWPQFKPSAMPVKTLWHFFLTTSVISVYVFFDVLVLGWMAGDIHVGYYTLAIKIIKLSLMAVLSINVILFPRISHLTTGSDVKPVVALIKKSMQFVLFLTVPMAVFFYLLAPHLIRLLAGPKFFSSIILIKILAALPMVIGFSNLLVYQVLLPFGKEKQLLYCVVGTCVGSLILHLTLTHFFIERGTATATLLTEALMTGLTAIVACRTLRISFPTEMMVQSVMACLPATGFYFLGRNLFSGDLPLLVFSAVPGGVMYVVMQLFLFKNSLLVDAWSSVRFWKWRAGNG